MNAWNERESLTLVTSSAASWFQEGRRKVTKKKPGGNEKGKTGAFSKKLRWRGGNDPKNCQVSSKLRWQSKRLVRGARHCDRELMGLGRLRHREGGRGDRGGKGLEGGKEGLPRRVGSLFEILTVPATGRPKNPEDSRSY